MNARAITSCLFVGGCFSPSSQPGTLCATECPGDLLCLDHICRSPDYMPDAAAVHDAPPDAFVPDGPASDLDGDGIPNTSDNCPAKPNLDQHNEDGDLIGDVCDPCPHLAGTNTDVDGDGVGDACDPQPTVAKQRIKFFDPFTSTQPGWLFSSNYSVSGDQLHTNTLGNTGADAHRPITTGALRIVTAGTIVEVDAASPHQVEITFGHSGTTYHYVQFYDEGAGGIVALMRANPPNYPALATTPYSGPLPTGTFSLRIDESVASHTMAMTGTLGGAPFADLSAAAPLLVSGTEFTLWVQNVKLDWDYFLVIETMP